MLLDKNDLELTKFEFLHISRFRLNWFCIWILNLDKVKDQINTHERRKMVSVKSFKRAASLKSFVIGIQCDYHEPFILKILPMIWIMYVKLNVLR